MEFDLENPLANSHDLHSDAAFSLFLIESDHSPSQSYLQSFKSRDFDITVRREVISLISQLSCAFDPVLSYLAINYLDRFLANQGISQPKPWVFKLLAVSCFSLAAKMMKTKFSVADIQGDGGVIFETQTIQRMETIILGALQWRMRSITPFSFIPFFITLFRLKHPPWRQVLKDRATEILFISQRERKLLEFKPSIIAAAALLSASHELFPLQYPCFLRAISDCAYVNKVHILPFSFCIFLCFTLMNSLWQFIPLCDLKMKVGTMILLQESILQCNNVIQDIAMEEYESVFDMVSSSETTINVLDHHFLSSESEKTNGTTTSATTLRQEKDVKRRKITGYGNNDTVHISPVEQC